MLMSFSLMFSSRSLMVSGLIFKSLIHFELIFVSGYDWVQFLFFFFGMWLSSFPNTFYLKDYLFPIKYSWLPCQTWVDCIYVYFHIQEFAWVCVFVYLRSTNTWAVTMLQTLFYMSFTYIFCCSILIMKHVQSHISILFRYRS